jgi:hypothetical protein
LLCVGGNLDTYLCKREIATVQPIKIPIEDVEDKIIESGSVSDIQESVPQSASTLPSTP